MTANEIFTELIDIQYRWDSGDLKIAKTRLDDLINGFMLEDDED
jgi:hypothetical protein